MLVSQTNRRSAPGDRLLRLALSEFQEELEEPSRVTVADLRTYGDCLAKVRDGVRDGDPFLVSQYLGELNAMLSAQPIDDCVLWENFECDGFPQLLFGIVESRENATFDNAIECLALLSASKRRSFVEQMVGCPIFGIVCDVFLTQKNKYCNAWAAAVFYNTVAAAPDLVSGYVRVDIGAVIMQQVRLDEPVHAFWLARTLALVIYVFSVDVSCRDVVLCLKSVLAVQKWKETVACLLYDLVMLGVRDQTFVREFCECDIWDCVRSFLERDASGMFLQSGVKLRKLGLKFLRQEIANESICAGERDKMMAMLQRVGRLIDISLVHKIICKTPNTKVRVRAISFAAKLAIDDPSILKTSAMAQILSYVIRVGWESSFDMKQASFRLLSAGILADSGEIFVGKLLEATVGCLMEAITWDDTDSALLDKILQSCFHLLNNPGVVAVRVRERFIEEQLPTDLERILATSPPADLAEKIQLVLRLLSDD